MKTKPGLKGMVNAIADRNIYINVNHLEKGTYNLHIIHNDKILISATFTKD